ncbi:MAG: NUDIX domain-containing protein [Acidimicrobiia bacterium]|nr:NUDIX domain-containing protein [Acidimicrobiia bacterium]
MARDGYVAAIRERIGSDPLLIVAAAAILTDAAGRVLLQHRADTRDWTPPGGIMDLGETLREVLERELREETRLELTGPATLLGIYSGPGYAMTYPNGDEIQAVICPFHCPHWSGTPTPDPESLELRWFERHALPAVHPHHRDYLDDHFAGRTGRVL